MTPDEAWQQICKENPGIMPSFPVHKASTETLKSMVMRAFQLGAQAMSENGKADQRVFAFGSIEDLKQTFFSNDGKN